MSRCLGDWLNGYLAFTENTEPSELYRCWTGVSVIASALQRKCFIKWGRSTLYPNLYIVLVGPPGAARKGTAMGHGLQFLLEPGLGIHIAVDSTSRASLIRDIKGAQETYVDGNGTVTTHSSITVYSPELTVFLGYKDLQLLTDLIDWYDSAKNPWVHKTIQGGPQEIPGVWFNLFGATTPDLLHSALPLEAIGGGLISRMLLIFAAKKGKKVHSDFETPEELELKSQLSQDLLQISNLGGGFKISGECLDYYNEWYDQFDEEKECKDSRFAGYFERKPTTLRKLCLITSAARCNDKVISVEDICRALALLDSVERSMYFALQGIGRNQYASVMNKIMTEILRLDGCTMEHLMARFRDEVTKFELDNVMKSLDAMKFCTIYENTGKIIPNKNFEE